MNTAQKQKYPLLLALSLSAAFASVSRAQTPLSAQTAVTLNATADEALTISATPGIVNFDLLNVPAFGDAPITVEVHATVSQLRTSLELELFFTDRATGLTNGATAIPSEWVYTDLHAAGAGSYAGCVFVTSASPAGGSCGTLQLNTAGDPLPSGFVHTQVVTILIALQALPVAGTYTGTLFAQVTAL